MICFAVIEPPADPEARFREICAGCKTKIREASGVKGKGLSEIASRKLEKLREELRGKLDI